MPPQTPHKPYVVKSTKARDVMIGLIAGIVILGFVVWGIMHMSQGITGPSLITGKITGKHFKPQPEEQYTVGKGWLNQRNIDGIYTVDVKTPDGKTYTVFVDKPVYESHQVGDDLGFLPPPSEQK